MSGQQTELSPAFLANFSGGCDVEDMRRHPLFRFIMSAGVQAIIENGASWFIDIIGSYQHTPEIRRSADLMHHQCWTLQAKGTGAVVTCQADSDQPAVISQEVEWTDFPLHNFPEGLKLWLRDGTLLLPCEY